MDVDLESGYQTQGPGKLLSLGIGLVPAQELQHDLRQFPRLVITDVVNGFGNPPEVREVFESSLRLARESGWLALPNAEGGRVHSSPFRHRPFGGCPFRRCWARGDYYGWAGDLFVHCRGRLLPHGLHHLQVILRPENVLYLSVLVFIYHGLNYTLDPIVPAKRELSLQAIKKLQAGTGNVPGPDPCFNLVPGLSCRIARRATAGDASIDQSQSARPVRETRRQV